MRPQRGALICALLSLIGLGISGYLYYLHLGLLRGELLGGVACGGGGLMNCHAVTSSGWGAFLGIPLSLWGAFGYLTTFSLSVIAWAIPERQPAAHALLALISLLFVAADLFLLGVMLWHIGHLCPLCVATYVVNGLMLAASFSALPGGVAAARQVPAALGAWWPTRRQPATWMFWTLVLVSGASMAGVHAATRFLTQVNPAAMRQRLLEYVHSGQRVYPDTANDPVRGRTEAPIALVEFSDFLCPVCERASKFNEIILASHRGDAKLIFKHFPLDSTCNDAVPRVVHPGACTIAAASECAHAQGKFWEFHDAVFAGSGSPGAHTPYPVARIEKDATRLGLDLAQFKECMASGKGLEAVKRDIEEGKRLQVSSTPTFAINGIKTAGIVSPAMFDVMAGTLKSVDP